MKRYFQSLSKGAKSSLALFMASVITSGISYIVTPIYTRLLPSEIYGQTSVFLTWLHIMGIVAMFGLANGVFNNGMSDWPDKRDEYSFSLLILSNIVTVIFTVILFGLYPFISKYIGLEKKYLLLMSIIFLVQPAYKFWVVRQRYEYKYKYVVRWAISCAILSPAVAIVSLLLLKGKDLLGARVFGAEIPLVIVYLGFYYYLGKKSGFKINRSYWKSAFLFNLPLLPHYLSLYLLNSSDKLMISYLISDSATAYYSVAYTVAAVATIVWNAINASLVPFTYEKCKIKDYAAINRVTIPIITMFAVVCLFVIMLAPEVVAIMATSEYKEAIYVIPPIVGGVFFQVLYFMYANVVYYYKKPKYVMVASVTATMLNLVLNYFFIQRYGYIAAGYTTLLCYMVQAIIDYIAMKKVVSEPVYNMRFILVISLIVISVSLLSNMTYDYVFIRYVVIFAIMIIGFIFRGRIVQTLRMIKE